MVEMLLINFTRFIFIYQTASVKNDRSSNWIFNLFEAEKCSVVQSQLLDPHHCKLLNTLSFFTGLGQQHWRPEWAAAGRLINTNKNAKFQTILFRIS